jgi:hypothetical protein
MSERDVSCDRRLKPPHLEMRKPVLTRSYLDELIFPESFLNKPHLLSDPVAWASGGNWSNDDMDEDLYRAMASSLAVELIRFKDSDEGGVTNQTRVSRHQHSTAWWQNREERESRAY